MRYVEIKDHGRIKKDLIHILKNKKHYINACETKPRPGLLFGPAKGWILTRTLYKISTRSAALTNELMCHIPKPFMDLQFHDLDSSFSSISSFRSFMEFEASWDVLSSFCGRSNAPGCKGLVRDKRRLVNQRLEWRGNFCITCLV